MHTKHKKFQKKYVFLQKSLRDFLYWRNFQSVSTGPSSFEEQKFIFRQEQEKSVFREYWKSSKIQKVQTFLNVLNEQNEFQSLFFEKFQSRSVNQFGNKTQSKRTLETQPRLQKSQTSKFKKQKGILRLKKRAHLQKFSQTMDFHSETFVPQSDIFQTFPLFSFFQQKSFYSFFPMKKEFQEYWIFPLLGFVCLCFPKNFQVQTRNQSFDFYGQSNLQDSSLLKFSRENLFALPHHRSSFSYNQKTKEEIFQNFQTVEKTEFQDFANWYYALFQKSFLSSFQNEPNIFLNVQKFKKATEEQRNRFLWTWFFVDSGNLSFSEKTGNMKTRIFEIPQKGQFFSNTPNIPLNFSETRIFDAFPQSLKNEKQSDFKNSKSLNQNVSKFTPLFDFVKSRALFSEFQKTGILQHSNISAKSFSLPLEIEDLLFLENIDFPRFKNFEKSSFHFSSRQNQESIFLQNWQKQQKFYYFTQRTTLKPWKKFEFEKIQRSPQKIFHQNFKFLDSIYSMKSLKPPFPPYFQNLQNFANQTGSVTDISSLKKSPSFFQVKKYTLKLYLMNSYYQTLQKFPSKSISDGFREEKRFENSKSFLQKPVFLQRFVQNEKISNPKIKQLKSPIVFHFFDETNSFFSNFQQYTQSSDQPKLFSNFFQVLENTVLSKQSYEKVGNPSILFSNDLKKQFFSISENTILKKLYFQNFSFSNLFRFSSSSNFFQQFFLFEKTNRHESLLIENTKKGFLSFSKNQEGQSKITFFSPSSARFFVKFPVEKNSVFEKLDLNDTKKIKTLSSQVFSRKFEKIFQTFFSPFSQNQVFSSLNLLSSSHFKTLPSQFDNIRKQKNDNDKCFLESFRPLILEKNAFSPEFDSILAFQKSKIQKTKKRDATSLAFRVSPEILLRREAFFAHPKLYTLSDTPKKSFFQHIEKEHVFQKKRRLKKQKLENRRRKKRKRFYPRPVWLRFQLYKKFLKTRQEKKIKTLATKNSKTGFPLSFFQDHSFQNQKKFFRKNQEKFGFLRNAVFTEKEIFKNSQLATKPLFSETNIYSTYFQNPVSQNLEHYRISGQILSEFLRLSWKSYSFQTNLKSYKNQISNYFQLFRKIENQPVSISQTLKFFDNDFLLRKFFSKKVLWYTNVSNPTFSIDHFQDFEKIQNIPEYHRLLYIRVSELFKNFKFLENTQAFIFRNFQLSKSGRDGNGKNPSFFTKTALLLENFSNPSGGQPEIPSFSLFSSLFSDVSVKPTGESPTLRSFWAFQKTNIFQFHEMNLVRNVWSFRKKSEILKKMKSTKKFVHFFQSLSQIENLQPAFANQKILQPYVFPTTKRTKLFVSQLNSFSLRKFFNIQQKSHLFGLNGMKQNSKISLRYFKVHLFSKPQNFESSNFSLLKQELKMANSQLSSTSSLNFWWSTKTFENFQAFQSLNFQIFPKLQSFQIFQTSPLFNQVFWFGIFAFHLAIFVTFFKLPEVRSVLKFQFLLFYKFVQSFGILLFSIATFFKTYIEKSFSVISSQQHFDKVFEKNIFFSKSKFLKNTSGSIGVSFQPTFQNSFVESFQQRKNFQASSMFEKDKFFFEFSTRFSRFSGSQLPNLGFEIDSSVFHSKTPIKFLKTEKDLYYFTFVSLILGRISVQSFYKILEFTSKCSGSVFTTFEDLFFAIYKFLEKPAEVIIEFIALIFFIEWSADLQTFLPSAYDTLFFTTSQKILRPVRTQLFLLGVPFQNSKFSLNGDFGAFSTPFLFQSPFAVFFTLNLTSFLLQKRFLVFFERFSFLLFSPDIDLLERQRKGMIFWDIWSEILLKAAEKYNVNIPSLTTLKEEQEVFIEKLIQEPTFFQNLSTNTSENTFYTFLENFQFSNQPSFSVSHYQLLDLFNKQRNFQTDSTKSKISQLFPSSIFFPLSSSHSSQSGFSMKSSSFLEQTNFQNLNPWSCTQAQTYQNFETDLFVDISPAKSFRQIPFLEYSEPSHYTVSQILCQVYSGLFSKQISKNILLLGNSGTFKTLFVQSLAGEAEMKFLHDNSSRYATIQKGVAVGMKYLREVFDSIALQTPCFFFLENIHLIGAKRPLLISDDNNIQAIQSSGGLSDSTQQEVHETNQMIYQLSRHLIRDFQRPYKGDFSMSIPTNFFVEKFSNSLQHGGESFFENSPFSGMLQSENRKTRSYPFPIDMIDSSLSVSQTGGSKSNGSVFQKSKPTSFLQISKDQIFAPPATSPFTVLMMKEQKKFQPKKIVQEISWTGLSSDQMLSYQKESLSIRSKVAMLADLTFNLSHGKFDMITDFLVIIDSVRSNRGFIVFGTTHLPSLLDPALRRPGRFDETLSLSQNFHFFPRFELLKTHFQSSISTFDFLEASLLTENFSEYQLFQLIEQTKLSFFHQYISKAFQKNIQTVSHNPLALANRNSSFDTTVLAPQFKQRTLSKQNLSHAFQNFLKSSFFSNFYSQSSKNRFSLSLKSGHLLNLAYSKTGIFLANSKLFQHPFSHFFVSLNIENFSHSKSSELVVQSLYFSKDWQKKQIQVFFAAKIPEFFLQSGLKNSTVFTKVGKTARSKNSFQRKYSVFSTLPNFLKKSKTQLSTQLLCTTETFSQSHEKMNLQYFQTNFSGTAFGTNTTWMFATPFIFSILQNRFFFTKNLLISKLLFFENSNQRRNVPNPPNSSILISARKYENFKRTENDFTKKSVFSIHEKLSFHQKQRFLKQLYNIPIQEAFSAGGTPKGFGTDGGKNRQISFSHSFQELGYLDRILSKPTSSDFYQKKYFQTRHRFSILNQWWTGMLPEHDTQTTYLSDVDWRTMFLSQFDTKSSVFLPKYFSPSSAQNSKQTFEFVMDFPDTEQYYNPRNRRWYFDKSFRKTDFQPFSPFSQFDKKFQYEIYYHFFMQSFFETFEFFENNREILDFCVSQLLRKGFLKEFELLSTISRFD